MSRVTIRDLRTRFPHLKQLIEREGEVLVTDRGRPAYVLRAYSRPSSVPKKSVDYFARLKGRQPRPIPAAASRALDELERGER
jgi:antitoxin (DNA-binding transcriptional repressor) of toxin-antitoxin stability system